MNPPYTYPMVSHQEVIDLFHSIAYWRYLAKQQEGDGKDWQKRWTTFRSVFRVLDKLKLLPAQRIKNLQQSKELCKLFLVRCKVIEQFDNTDISTLLDNERTRPFALRISQKAMIAGNRIRPDELFSAEKVFLTLRGISTAPIAVEAVERLVTKSAFEQAWQEIIAAIPEDKFKMIMAGRSRKDAEASQARPLSEEENN